MDLKDKSPVIVMDITENKGERGTKLDEKDVGPVLCRFTLEELSILLIHPNRFKSDDEIGTPSRMSLRCLPGTRTIDCELLISSIRGLYKCDLFGKDVVETTFAELNGIMAKNRAALTKGGNAKFKETKELMEQFKKLAVEEKIGVPPIKQMLLMTDEAAQQFKDAIAFCNFQVDTQQIKIGEQKAQGGLMGYFWPVANKPDVAEAVSVTFPQDGSYGYIAGLDDGGQPIKRTRVYKKGDTITALDIGHLRKGLLHLHCLYLQLFGKAIEHFGVLTSMHEAAQSSVYGKSEDLMLAQAELRSVLASQQKQDEEAKRIRAEEDNRSSKKQKRGN